MSTMLPTSTTTTAMVAAATAVASAWAVALLRGEPWAYYEPIAVGLLFFPVLSGIIALAAAWTWDRQRHRGPPFPP
jgi:hypothetical protein